MTTIEDMEFKTTEELKDVPIEMYARVLARAEQAEAALAAANARIEILEAGFPFHIIRAEQTEAALALANARVGELEHHLEKSGIYGNAGRYWEGRWRDEHTGAAHANARVGELEAALKEQLETKKWYTDRFERAEAECVALRDLLCRWQRRFCHMSNIGELQHDTYTALATSPAAVPIAELTIRAERAEAECVTLREDTSPAPVPAGREG